MTLAFDLRPLLESQPGGVGAYTQAMFDALRELPGIELRPLLTGVALPPPEVPDYPATRRLTVPNTILNLGLRTLRWPRLDRLVGADRYLLPNWNFLSLGKNTELTLVVHDLSFVRNPGWFSPRQRLWHRAVAPRRLAARADRLIAVSAWTKHDLVTLYGLPEEKISVIYPLPDRPPVDLPFPLALPDRFILFLGAVEERKNPLTLLEAFERLAAKHPETHLLLAGRFGFGSDRLARAARQSPAADRIHLLGYVPRAVRQALYHQATVFAYPSFYEGFGIPVVEAMAAGRPVVVGNRSALPEVVGDAGILVDPGDVNQLCLALDSILSDEQFARSLGGRAFVRAAQFPDSMTPALRKLFA